MVSLKRKDLFLKNLFAPLEASLFRGNNPPCSVVARRSNSSEERACPFTDTPNKVRVIGPLQHYLRISTKLLA